MDDKNDKANEKQDKKVKPAKKQAIVSGEFVAVVGINYPTATGEKRLEAGESASDIPARSIPWLLETGAIKQAGE
mgnify:CR=1 FL=1